MLTQSEFINIQQAQALKIRQPQFGPMIRWQNISGVQNIQKKMLFFRRILQIVDNNSPTVPYFLQAAEIQQNSELPKDYYDQIYPKGTDIDQHLRTFAHLIKPLNCHSTPALIKTLTVVLETILQQKFNSGFLEELEDMTISPCQNSLQGWMKDLLMSVKSYLLRLPSLTPVLSRAQSKDERQELPFDILLADLYLLLNLQGLLFPHLTNALNTVGRYYFKASPYFGHFYNVICQHVFRCHDYMRIICTKYTKGYKECSLNQIRCFLQTLPEIQLLCDKMEELLLNKYFKGKGASYKIYFKEQQIGEITYYVKNEESKKDNDSTKTAEEEALGQLF